MSDRFRRAAPVAAVLALLAAVSAGAWVVWGDGSDPALASNVTLPDPTPRLPYQEIKDVVVEPPGDVVFERKGQLAGYNANGLLTEAELKIVEEQGGARISSTVTRDGGTTLGIWRFTVKDGVAPGGLFAEMDGLYKRGGHKDVQVQHQDVSLRLATSPEGISVYHGHYVHGQDVFRIEGYGKDAAAVTKAVTELLDRQVKRTPAQRPAA
ncbi:hypothetical protein [Lentzea californiensis]|uniref:hypothetical protein n=1 Tax=Lentzea californiensis TaxID=438851 RepID=UPI0021646EBE|nr:hypothetical protein [Lentzea californiensis]MCR3747132.1 hypothetical protein [Lentzea californiensis]